jgi:type I restriction enzyme S subunit
MTPDRLLQHFDRIAEVPDAVPRLRRFILDLAVRGKLVKQDPDDESAAEQLNQARRRLELAAETTKRLRWNPSAAVTITDYRENVPSGWLAARLNDTGLYINGLPFKPTDWKQEGLPIIRIQNLTDPSREFNYATGDFPDEVLVCDGDILVSWSATLEAFKWDRGHGVLNQHIFRVIPDDGLTVRDYLLLLLRNAIREMADSVHAHGLVMTHINRGPFLNHIVLIPPLAEQHRIVAKVDELMALCDRLEAAQSKREQRRDRLVAASLNRLNQPAPSSDGEAATAFREHARFHLDHLTRLATRPEHIKSLRQTILKFAFQGHFSTSEIWPQTPNRLADFAYLQNGYAFKSEWFAKSGIRLLRNANVGHGLLDWTEEVRLPPERVPEFERFQLRQGDVVLSLDRPFIVTGTKVARVREEDLPALLLQRVGRFCLNDEILPDYLYMWINSPAFSDQIDPGRSNGVPHISSKQVEAATLFIPPLAEQHRIVAKVDELMAVCDQLERQLETTQTDSRRLLDAVLHEALVPAMEEAA